MRDRAKWPVLLLVVWPMLSILDWASPNVKHRFRWASPGAVVGVVLWLLASAGFALYVANFGHYNKTYGALGGVIVWRSDTVTKAQLDERRRVNDVQSLTSTLSRLRGVPIDDAAE